MLSGDVFYKVQRSGSHPILIILCPQAEIFIALNKSR